MKKLSYSEVALVTLKTPAFLVVVVQIKVTFEALDAKVDHRFLELGSTKLMGHYYLA